MDENESVHFEERPRETGASGWLCLECRLADWVKLVTCDLLLSPGVTTFRELADLQLLK